MTESYWVTEQEYVGPDCAERPDDHEYHIQTTDPDYQWSEVDGVALTCHGKYDSITDAAMALMEISGPFCGMRYQDLEDYDDDIVCAYKPGLYAPCGPYMTREIFSTDYDPGEVRATTSDAEIAEWADNWCDNYQYDHGIDLDRDTLIACYARERAELDAEEVGAALSVMATNAAD